MSRSYCQRHFPVAGLQRDDAIGGAADVDQVAGRSRRARSIAPLPRYDQRMLAGLGIDRVEAAVVGADVDLPARGVEARLAVDAARTRGHPVDVAGRRARPRRPSPAREPITRRPPASTPDAHSSGDGSNRPCSCSVVRQTICRMPARWAALAASSGARDRGRGTPGRSASSQSRRRDGTDAGRVGLTSARAPRGGSRFLRATRWSDSSPASRDRSASASRRVALQLGQTRLRGSAPGPCRSRPEAASSPSLRERRLRLGQLALLFVGVAEALVGQEPQPRVELARQQLLVDALGLVGAAEIEQHARRDDQRASGAERPCWRREVRRPAPQRRLAALASRWRSAGRRRPSAALPGAVELRGRDALDAVEGRRGASRPAPPTTQRRGRRSRRPPWPAR